MAHILEHPASTGQRDTGAKPEQIGLSDAPEQIAPPAEPELKTLEEVTKAAQELINNLAEGTATGPLFTKAREFYVNTILGGLSGATVKALPADEQQTVFYRIEGLMKSPAVLEKLKAELKAKVAAETALVDQEV